MMAIVIHSFCLSTTLLLSQAAAPAEADPGVGVGRKALGESGTYPWYDAPADDLKRINVQPVSQPGKWNWNFGGVGGFGASLLEIVIWTVIALVLGLLVYLLIRAYLNRENRPSKGGVIAQQSSVNDAARIEALPFRLRRGDSDLLSQARLHYEQGNYREAIIYLFSHQLVELDRNQVIRLARGKTNRQYLREVKSRPTLRGLVEQTMVAFEDVFFGEHELEQSRFEACWTRLDEFASLSRQGGE